MKKNLSLLLQLGLFGCLSYFLHELAHLFAHYSLGHTVDFKINHMTLITPKVISAPWQQAWVSGSGALFSFAQGGIAFYMLKKHASLLWFNVLLAAFSLRFAAALLGLVKSSDEIKTSIAMGLPSYFWTIVVLGGLFLMLNSGRKVVGIPTKQVLGHFLFLLLVTYLFSLISV